MDKIKEPLNSLLINLKIRGNNLRNSLKTYRSVADGANLKKEPNQDKANDYLNYLQMAHSDYKDTHLKQKKIIIKALF